MMTQLPQSTIEPRSMQPGPHGERALLNDERSRLQVLVGELLSENQRLRFENEGLRAQSEQLKHEAQSAKRGLKQATKWAGMMV